jgi:integrase
MIRAWKKETIAKARNVVARKHATTAVNSTLRQARSLFGERKVLKFISLAHNPFKDVEFESRMDMRFHGTSIDAPTLLRRAMKDLEQEELKAFLLAIATGLRRKEADLLEWSSFNFAESTIEIRPTEHYGLKSSALRHTSVELTSSYYLDHSVRKTSGLGSVNPTKTIPAISSLCE